MGVYVKDMEMPSGCISCPFKSHGTIDEFKYYCDMTGVFVGSWESKKLNQRHKDCPLVEEKTGKWVEDDDATVKGHCSVCGWESHYYEDDVVGMPFCPNCGTRMVN